MGYVDPDNLEDKAVALIYIAGKTSEAKAVEGVLTQNDVTYTIKPTPFLRSSLFGGMIELPGVGFYVAAEHAASGRALLKDRKFRVGLVLEGEE